MSIFYDDMKAETTVSRHFRIMDVRSLTDDDVRYIVETIKANIMG